jgi:hypothetical protein
MKNKSMQIVAISFAVCVCFMGILGVATAQPAAEIQPSTTVVDPGDTFDVSVFLDTEGDRLVSGSVKYLTFDPAVLETSTGDIVPGDLWETPVVAKNEVNNTAGTIWFDIGDTGWQAQTPPGDYMTVRFTVKDTAAAGTYPLTITWMRFMDENGDVWVTPTLIVTNASFTVTVSDEEAPSVSNPQAVPDAIDPDNTEVTTLSVTVTDNYGVASVTVDLSAIGKSATTAMNPAGGDIYSVTTTAAVGIAHGTYNLLVTATDTSANSNTAVSIPLTINDIVAPTVTSVSPADQATGVDTDESISATFSEAMDHDSVQEAFSVDGITGTFTWAGNKVTFTPGSDLDYETKYTCTISTDATDAAGNNLVEDYVWEFTTESKRRVGGGGGGAAITDKDGDGLSDIDEIITYKTDPNKADTDGGGVNDGEEVARGTDPLDPDDDIPTPTPTPTPKPTPTPTMPPTPTRTPTATPTPEPSPEEPGFEALFAITGLLAIAFVILRRKQ